jgi:peptidylprolyl isomerase
VAVSAASGCQLKEEESSRPQPGDGPPPVPPPPDVAAPPADALKTPSGIASKVLIVGLGSIHPTLQNRVTVHYTGWTKDGKSFDSTYSRGEATTFGLTQVIPGWQQALQLMVVGEKRRFWIPGHLAYDTDPRTNVPKGPLVFEIELLDIK